MSVVKEAAIVAGRVSREVICFGHNLFSTNKAHVMPMEEGEGPARLVTWKIIYQNPGETLEIPTPFFDVDEFDEKE